MLDSLADYLDIFANNFVHLGPTYIPYPKMHFVDASNLVSSPLVELMNTFVSGYRIAVFSTYEVQTVCAIRATGLALSQ